MTGNSVQAPHAVISGTRRECEWGGDSVGVVLELPGERGATVVLVGAVSRRGSRRGGPGAGREWFPIIIAPCQSSGDRTVGVWRGWNSGVLVSGAAIVPLFGWSLTNGGGAESPKCPVSHGGGERGVHVISIDATGRSDTGIGDTGISTTGAGVVVGGD